MSEKTHAPTHQRVRQARKRGQVAVSQDLCRVLKLCIVAEVAFALVPRCYEVIGHWIWRAALAPTESFQAGLRLASAGWPLAAGLLVGLPALGALVAWAVTLAQTRMNFAAEALQGGPGKLSPATNLKQMFSVKKLIAVPLGLAKVGSALAIGVLVVRGDIGQLVLLPRVPLEQEIAWGLARLHVLERSLLAALAVWALGDFALQKYLTFRSLRMDRSEVQRDYKEAEGDPHAKGHRKAIAKQVALEPVKAIAPGASAVVVNPEHIAVAIAFDTRLQSLPRIVGVAIDAGAADMRQLAARRRLPIVKYVSLARALRESGQEGQPVPREVLRPVALLHRLLESLPSQGDIRGDPNRVYVVDEEQAQAVLDRKTHSVSITVGELSPEDG